MADAALTSRKPLGIFLASLFLLLVFMSYQVTDENTGRTVLGNVLFRIFSPVQLVIAGSVRTVVNTLTNYVALAGASRENSRLKNEVTELRIRLAASLHERDENERLRHILDLGQKLPYTLVAGEVIARDAKAEMSETVTVNRGSSDGIHLQMPVITPVSIVGMTIQIAGRTSRVQLITDPSSSIGAMLQRERVSGILSGLGSDLAVLKFLPLRTAVHKDDIIVTSGQDGIFPEGLSIGKVTRFMNESQYYKSVEVIPFQNFSSLQEVVFLLQQKSQSPIQ
jgi:rod shape-determining protein MreC